MNRLYCLWILSALTLSGCLSPSPSMNSRVEAPKEAPAPPPPSRPVPPVTPERVTAANYREVAAELREEEDREQAVPLAFELPAVPATQK